MTRNLAVGIVTILMTVAGQMQPAAIAAGEAERWVGTWSAALHAPAAGPPGLTNQGFDNQTLRQIVRTTVGGDRVRVRVSTFGAGALAIGAAHVALRAAGAAIVAASDRTLTFGGHPSVIVPAGAVVVSDPIDLHVPPLTDLAVSLYVPAATGPAAWHFAAMQTSYVSPGGDFTASVVMPVAATTQAWFWLTGVEVMTSKHTAAVVVLGDSVTDGTRSTPDANMRWPDRLAQRLVKVPGNHTLGVLKPDSPATGCSTTSSVPTRWHDSIATCSHNPVSPTPSCFLATTTSSLAGSSRPRRSPSIGSSRPIGCSSNAPGRAACVCSERR